MLGNFFKILHDSCFFAHPFIQRCYLISMTSTKMNTRCNFFQSWYLCTGVCVCSLWMLLYKISATFILTQCYQAYTDFLWNHEIMFCSYVLLLPNQITVALFHLLFTTEKLAPIFVLSCWMKEKTNAKKEWIEKSALLFEAESTSKLHLPV